MTQDSGETTPVLLPKRQPSWRRQTLWLLGTVLGCLAVFFGGSLAYFRWSFPYGWSHCCILQFSAGFEQYAQKYHGFLPAGEANPEASLSLLHQFAPEEFPCDLLRGKTVPLETAERALARDGRLGPESCGWHYVEGLTLTDDRRLAVLWDKIGLGHNGQRLTDGGHEVLYLSGFRDFIPGAEWPQFLTCQEQLLAARTEAARQGRPWLTAQVKLPSGEIVDHYDAPFALLQTTQDACDTGSGTSSGGALSAERLRWYRRDLVGSRVSVDMTITMALTLGPWQSKPVQIHVSDGVPTPDSLLFELEETGPQPPAPTRSADPPKEPGTARMPVPAQDGRIEARFTAKVLSIEMLGLREVKVVPIEVIPLWLAEVEILSVEQSAPAFEKPGKVVLAIHSPARLFTRGAEEVPGREYIFTVVGKSQDGIPEYSGAEVSEIPPQRKASP